MEKQFEKQTFQKRLKSMLKVDFRRAFTSSLLYILVAVAFAMPVLILVMTTMMDGSVTVDQYGNETVMEGFDFVWQILGSVSGNSAQTEGAGMGLTTMCNVNLVFFALSVFVCLFVSAEFRSGYAKNLFAVRAKETDYILSKSVVCFVFSTLVFVSFFLGTLVGGAVSGLPYTMDGFNAGNILFCMLSKIMLAPVFSSIFLLASVGAKQKSWLSLCISLGAGALLFMMIPMLTPLNANFFHVVGCAFGSLAFGVGLGAIGVSILNKTDLI